MMGQRLRIGGPACALFLVLFGSMLIGCGHSIEDRSLALIYRDRGHEHMKQRRYGPALEALLEAKKIEDNDPYVHLYLGETYYRRGKFEEAEKSLRDALKRKKDFPQAHNNLGNVYLSQGRSEEAIAQYELAVDNLIYSTPWIALNNLGWAYYVGKDYNKAASYYQSAIDAYPRFPPAHYNLGLIHMRQGNIDEAEIEFKLAVKFYPRYVQAHMQLGQVYEKLNRPKKAIDHYLQVTRMSPGSDEGVQAQRRLNEINP